jgi:hypothetical protein
MGYKPPLAALMIESLQNYSTNRLEATLDSSEDIFRKGTKVGDNKITG